MPARRLSYASTPKALGVNASLGESVTAAHDDADLDAWAATPDLPRCTFGNVRRPASDADGRVTCPQTRRSPASMASVNTTGGAPRRRF